MKTMTCKQLGGACDQTFQASFFQEIGGMSQQHAMEMMQKGDKDHLDAMEKMKVLMQTPDGMAAWMENKKAEFDALPEDE